MCRPCVNSRFIWLSRESRLYIDPFLGTLVSRSSGDPLFFRFGLCHFWPLTEIQVMQQRIAPKLG